MEMAMSAKIIAAKNLAIAIVAHTLRSENPS